MDRNVRFDRFDSQTTTNELPLPDEVSLVLSPRDCRISFNRFCYSIAGGEEESRHRR